MAQNGPPFQYFSQYKQDQFVHENFFWKKQGGVFLDIGAGDGITISNTYFFEKQRGWKGLCIEPRPSVFQKLFEVRTCYCENLCLLDRETTVDFLEIEGWGQGLSGVIQEYDPRHLNRIEREMVSPMATHSTSRMIRVKAVKLESLLMKYDLWKIDFCSLDTEGSEQKILETIDFEKTFIDVITVENNYGESTIYDFLKERGYRQIVCLGCDEIYKRVE